MSLKCIKIRPTEQKLKQWSPGQFNQLPTKLQLKEYSYSNKLRGDIERQNLLLKQHVAYVCYHRDVKGIFISCSTWCHLVLHVRTVNWIHITITTHQQCHVLVSSRAVENKFLTLYNSYQYPVALNVIQHIKITLGIA